MRRPAIFISHSAHEPEAAQALDALHALLEAQGFTVLLDRRRLAGGDAWETEIRHWLDVCHGAVILLSPRALTSNWVHTETSILLQRAQRASAFPVIPLTVAGVDSGAVAASALHSSGVPALQAAAWEPGATVPAVVAAAFAGLLREAQADSPTYRLELAVAEKLKALRTPTLIQTGRCLDLDLDTYAHDQDPVGALAVGLVEASHDIQIRACTELAELADVTVGTKVYSWVAPRSWVTPPVAARVREVARAKGKRWIGVTATEIETYDMYVRSGYFRWRLDSAAMTGEDAASELLEELASLVAASLKYLPGEPFELDDLNEELEQDPRFVLLRHPLPPAEALEAIALRLPNLVLLLACPRDGDPPPANVTVLEPLDPERETRLVRAHRTMHRRLTRMQEES